MDNQDKYGNRIKRDANGDITSINTAVFNALGLKTKGIDTNLSYAFDSVIGNTSFNLGYTYVSEYKQQDTADTPFVDYVAMAGSNDYPLKHRANASILLKPNDVWAFGWATQYYGSYTVTNATAVLNQTGKDTKTLKINDQLYHDIFAKAKLPFSKFNKRNAAEVGFGVQNLFNDYTVDLSSSKGYLSKYSDLRGRQYYLNLKLSF